MLLIEDSRQKDGKHNHKNEWFKANHHEIVRCKLPFGDYTALNNVYIDTKEHMGEIASNLCSTKAEHERFRNECILAQKFGKHLYVLVENTDGIKRLSEVKNWLNPRRFVSNRAVNGERLCKSMDTIQKKYGVTFVFCEPENAAANIVYLLERDT